MSWCRNRFVALAWRKCEHTVSRGPCPRYASHNAPTSDLPKPRLDYRAITEAATYKSHNAFNRKAPVPVGAIKSITRHYEERKAISGELDFKRHARNSIGQRIRNTKTPEEKKSVTEEAKALKADIHLLEMRLSELDDKLLELALVVPNDTHPSTPLGPEEAAVVLSTHGPEPLPCNPKRDHVSVGQALGLFGFEAGALVTGSSWYYLQAEAALLEMALTNYAMSIAVKHGYQPVMTPDVIRADIATRCGFQPRDERDVLDSQMYHIAQNSSSSHPDLVLSGTAEIPLAGLHANRVLEESSLPLRMVGLGRSFRAEAGARGADTRGLYRVHQFSKLELFVLSTENASEAAMEDIRRVQVEIFEGLGIPFRVLDMPTEELGASAFRKYDMEAWMPGRGSWGEISSTSNCTDYQARRLHIRYRRSTSLEDAAQPSVASLPFVHTLNGTAAAIPRLIVALVENGAIFNGEGKAVGLNLPHALKPYWMGSGTVTNRVRWV
ncbi:seryl-tRNA synthetase [Coniophora puteana RWD-64-598 SS2]|uniref:serine--tRNA ligase n=1 Tax=Coniophora puteana (strain RWD-64-598) TaxID=741705 RepID=A0A5M3N6L2_CONPW|nr:seryl-tRNA synthetase [Coniophora puteana RWD-64-598 SS2]EIW87072.1 seryl-tRNA synthetase [Coniophora puteana RWD-64-598 SS2]